MVRLTVYMAKACHSIKVITRLWPLDVSDHRLHGNVSIIASSQQSLMRKAYFPKQKNDCQLPQVWYWCFLRAPYKQLQDSRSNRQTEEMIQLQQRGKHTKSLAKICFSPSAALLVYFYDSKCIFKWLHRLLLLHNDYRIKKGISNTVADDPVMICSIKMT